MSVLRRVRIKCSEFRENVRTFFPPGTKQTDDCIKPVSVKRGLTVVRKVAPKGCLWFYLDVSVTAFATAVNQVRPLILPVKADLPKVLQFPSV